MELNCPICKTPMKAYHGLFEKDMYCDNANCGKPKTVTYTEKVKVTINGEEVKDLDPDAGAQQLAKAINDALKEAFSNYIGIDFGNLPKTSDDDQATLIGQYSLDCAIGPGLDIIGDAYGIVRGVGETDVELRERIQGRKK